MTIKDLIDLVDYNRETDYEIIQICEPGGNWDEYVEFKTSSILIEAFEDRQIASMAAIREDCIRVDLVKEE